MTRCAFITITDYERFPGTLATVSSVREFSPGADIFVINNEKRPITTLQAECLREKEDVRLVRSTEFAGEARYGNTWELKAYSASVLAESYDVIVGIDAGCLLCSNVETEIRRCFELGLFLAVHAGLDADYDHPYRVYGISTPARNSRCISTALFFCAVTGANRRILRRWADCCSAAVFNGRGPYPGDGDQGILNAVLFAEEVMDRVELLDSRLWTGGQSIIDYREGVFINLSVQAETQRAFHCSGGTFWAREHSEQVLGPRSWLTYPYAWFLTMLWFGDCRDWRVDPLQYIPPPSYHLVNDLVLFLPQIIQIYARAREIWDHLSDPMIERILMGIPRALNLGGGSMSEVFQLVTNYPEVRRYVEIGSYEGGSIMALGLRFANRDIDFYSVESFMGNMNGTMDGRSLPSRSRYMRNLARFPNLRVSLVPGDSGLAAILFEDRSIDFLFIDDCHDTPAVIRDIDTWRPKISGGGIIAGDDYNWQSVRLAVEQRFQRVNITPSGIVWWVKQAG